MMIASNKDYSFVTEQQFTINQICDSSLNSQCCAHLEMATAHGMIKRLLLDKKMSKQEVANSLGITLSSFEKFNSVSGYKQLAPKVSYRLICLYCQTKWN